MRPEGVDLGYVLFCIVVFFGVVAVLSKEWMRHEIKKAGTERGLNKRKSNR